MNRKLKSIIFAVFFVVLAIFFIYFFLLPPKIVSIEQKRTYDERIGKEITEIKVRFNKPVKRKGIEYSIEPNAIGELRFENPVFFGHCFTSAVFLPAVNLKPGTAYRMTFSKLENTFGLASISSAGFEADASVAFEAEPEVTLINTPFDWQDYPLSCEAASLKMALKSKGISVSEDELISQIGYSEPLVRANNVWGNPDEAFVGNIKGKMCKTGYGVYWNAVAKTAEKYRPSEAFSKWDLKKLVKELKNGNPVVVWGTLPKDLHDCSWYTNDGNYVKAYKETHVRLAVGFIGPSDNPQSIILNDPLSGQFYWSSDYFMKNWSAFNYSGVVVR